MSKIELRRIDESNFIDCFNLKLKKEQERFVSHPIRSLAQAYVYYKQCTPFGVVADGEMVGYGMVIYDYDEEEYDLWHVMIDAEQQGKGYGKAAVGLFLDYIRQKPFGDSDLVKLTCRKISSDPIQMREVAAQALSDMFDAAKADGVTLYAHSGYRSYRTQKTMYSNRLKRNNGKDDGVVAYPGASDHQTGLGIDVINKAGIGKKFTPAFANTKEGKWIAEHCWDYGFVIRYQKEKEEITQITYEPWHLRYVGVQIAQYMRENNLCLE